MNLPSRERCFELLREEGTPDNIIQHSIVVNRISLFLAKRLTEQGIIINADLVDRASLLHDIKKWESLKLKSDKTHGEMGARMLESLYPEIAYLVRNHMLGSIIHLKTWEEKVVNYADKRVNNDEIVSLEDRFKYLQKRYQHNSEIAWKEMYVECKRLESEIFSIIKESPDILFLLHDIGCAQDEDCYSN